MVFLYASYLADVSEETHGTDWDGERGIEFHHIELLLISSSYPLLILKCPTTDLAGHLQATSMHTGTAAICRRHPSIHNNDMDFALSA